MVTYEGILCILTFHLLATNPENAHPVVTVQSEHDFSNFLLWLDLSLLTDILRVFLIHFAKVSWS